MQLLEMAAETAFDLLFLDIDLGDMNAVVLVNVLKNMHPDRKIVFMTAYSEYAVRAFELGVKDYVLKHFDSRRLKKTLIKCGVLEIKDAPASAG